MLPCNKGCRQQLQIGRAKTTCKARVKNFNEIFMKKFVVKDYISFKLLEIKKDLTSDQLKVKLWVGRYDSFLAFFHQWLVVYLWAY